MDATNQVSVILCAYTLDRWEVLKAAIASILRQETHAAEIILVIDHNPELLEKTRAQFSGVTVVENHGPAGLSGARNTGVELARQAIVAFMDEDAAAQPDWLTWLLRGYQDSQVIGVGGTVEPDWLGERPAWFPEEFNWVVGCSYKGGPEMLQPVRNLLGCNMSFRRELFDSTGKFQNNLGRSGQMPTGNCEETEFCIRANRKFPQGRFLYDPRARVRHIVPMGRATWQYFRSRCYAEGCSKAQVTQSVGANKGLAAERQYTARTLPLGMLRGIGDFFSRSDLSGLLRAGAIAAGLAFTTAGFLAGSVPTHRKLADYSSQDAAIKGLSSK